MAAARTGTPGNFTGRSFRGLPVYRPRQSRPIVAVGFGVIVSIALIGFAVIASALVVRTVGAALFSGQMRSGSTVTTGPQQILQLQSRLVEQRREAIVTYAAQLVEYKNAIARPAGAVGINLDAAEAARRDGVLTGLVLDCIYAVDGYNLAAQSRSAGELRSAGVPPSFDWVIDCASGQQAQRVENR